MVGLHLLLYIALAVAQHDSKHPYLNPSYTPEERAEDLLKLMTWEEKIGQLGGARRLFDRVNGKPSFNETALAITLETQDGQIGMKQCFIAAHVKRPYETPITNFTCRLWITAQPCIGGVDISKSSPNGAD